MSSLHETLYPKPSAPPAQEAPTAVAAAEQGLLPGGSDSLSALIQSPKSSAPPSAAAAASAQIEDPKPSAVPAAPSAPKSSASPVAAVAASALKSSASPVSAVAASARAERAWLRPVIKLASWPVRRVFSGMGRVCDILVSASQRPVVVRCAAKVSAIIPARVRVAVPPVLLLFDSFQPGYELLLPISDPAPERLYIELNMERIGLLVLAVVAAGAILFITLEVLVMAGFVSRYDQYVDILLKFVRFLQWLLQVVSKVSGFYGNVKWHLAEAARMRQEAAERQLQVPTLVAKKQLSSPAPEQRPTPPAIERQLPPPAAELLIPTPPPPEMDIC